MKRGDLAICVRYSNVWSVDISTNGGHVIDRISKKELVLILEATKTETKVLTQRGLAGWTDRTNFLNNITQTTLETLDT